MEQKSQLSYVCVHCGNDVEGLFKQFSPTVLKLINCDNCLKEADKYIEYDNVIILIDLILFKAQAYRHIIHNSEFKNHWKLGILVLLMKTYNEWATHCFEPKYLGPLVLEHTFYTSFLVALAGSLMYGAVLFATVGLYEFKRITTRPPFKNQVNYLWKALVLSNFGQFLLLPSLIWTDLQRQTQVIFVVIYSLLSQMQALSGMVHTEDLNAGDSIRNLSWNQMGWCKKYSISERTSEDNWFAGVLRKNL